MTRYPSAQRGSALFNLFSIHLRPEMKELYQFSVLFSFASALITIFEPIFFYQQAIPLHIIAAYYAIHYSIYLFVLPLGAKFAAYFGLEKSLSVSLPVFVVYFLTLAGIPDYPWLFWAALFLLTLHKIFYWPAYHAAIAKMGDSKNRGTELSWLTVLRFGVGIAGPLIGGIIANWWGFQVLFVVTAVTVLISCIPLLRTRERYSPREFLYGGPWQLIRTARVRGMVLAMLGMGENLVELVFWPIFMFIVLASTETVGFISALTVAIMAVVGFGIGELSDRFSRRAILRVHLPFMILGYLFRPLAFTPMGILLTDTLNKVAFIGVNLPMTYRLYEQAKGSGYLRYVTAFEMVLAFAKAITAWFFVWLFYVSLPYTAFMWAFILSAIVTLFYFFL